MLSPGVFCDSGDTPANLLCELNGHLMPCTSCFYDKWVEDVCTGQFGVYYYYYYELCFNANKKELLTMTMSRFSHSWSGTVSFSTSSSDIPLKRSRFFRAALVASAEADCGGGGAEGEHLVTWHWPPPLLHGPLLISSRLLLLLLPFRHLHKGTVTHTHTHTHTPV